MRTSRLNLPLSLLVLLLSQSGLREVRADSLGGSIVISGATGSLGWLGLGGSQGLLNSGTLLGNIPLVSSTAINGGLNGPAGATQVLQVSDGALVSVSGGFSTGVLKLLDGRSFSLSGSVLGRLFDNNDLANVGGVADYLGEGVVQLNDVLPNNSLTLSGGTLTLSGGNSPILKIQKANNVFTASGSASSPNVGLATGGSLVLSTGSGSPGSKGIVSVDAGKVLTLDAAALGGGTLAPGLSFQWFKNGIALLGATNASLTLPKVSTQTAGEYSLESKSAAAPDLTTTSSLKLTVRDPFAYLCGRMGALTAKLSLTPLAKAGPVPALLSANLTKTGSLSLTLSIGAKVYRLAGKFDKDWRWVVAFPPGFVESEMEFRVSWPAGEQFPGLAVILRQADGFTVSTTPVMRVGVREFNLPSVYTASFSGDGPGLSGYLSGSVAGKGGRLVLTGVLPSGDFFSGSALVHDIPEAAAPEVVTAAFDCVLPLGAKATALSSLLLGPDRLTGSFFVSPRAEAVPPTTYDVSGYAYRSGTGKAAQLPDGLGSSLAFNVLDADGVPFQAGSLTVDGGRLVVAPSANSQSRERLRFNLNARTGVFSGSYGVPVPNVSSAMPKIQVRNFSGVILQNLNYPGAGITSQGQAVQIVPSGPVVQ